MTLSGAALAERAPLERPSRLLRPTSMMVGALSGAALAERTPLQRTSRLLRPTNMMVGALSGAACPRQVPGRPKKSRFLALVVQCGHFCSREIYCTIGSSGLCPGLTVCGRIIVRFEPRRLDAKADSHTHIYGSHRHDSHARGSAATSRCSHSPTRGSHSRCLTVAALRML